MSCGSGWGGAPFIFRPRAAPMIHFIAYISARRGLSGYGTCSRAIVRISSAGLALSSAARKTCCGSCPALLSISKAPRRMLRAICFLPCIIIMLTKRACVGDSLCRKAPSSAPTIAPSEADGSSAPLSLPPVAVDGVQSRRKSAAPCSGGSGALARRSSGSGALARILRTRREAAIVENNAFPLH